MEQNVIQINGGIAINVDVSVKSIYMCTCICENGKYLASIMGDSVIPCDQFIESYDKEVKTVPTNFNEQNITCETQSFYILLTFSLITIT